MIEKTELERIVDASPTVLYRFERCNKGDGFVMTYISASVTNMLAYERHECLEVNWWRAHIHPDDLRAVENHIRNLSQSGEEEYVYRFAAKSGDYRWLRDHVRLRKGVHGRPDEFIGSWLDITESRQRDQQMDASEELMLHRDRSDALLKLPSLASELDELAFIQQAQELMEELTGSYDDRDIESVQLISDAIWQIVQRQREQRSLIKSEEKYRTLFEESSDMMHIVGADGCINDVNRAELDVLGYAYHELVGQPVKNIICPKHLEDSRHHIRQLFEGKSVPLYQTSLHCKNGECVPVEVSASPQFENGKVVAGRAVIHDLRERIRQETRELEFNQILEESLNEIYIINAENLNFIRVNRGARLNLGYELQELLSMTPVDIKPDFTIEQFNSFIAPIERGEQESIDFEATHQRKDGSCYPVMVNLQRSTFDGEAVYVAFIQDISARKASEQKYRTLFESSSDAILMLDEEAILDCNESSLRMFSCHSRDDFIGKHPSELSPEKQPGGHDSLRLANEHIAAAFRKGSHHFEWVHKRLDGSEFPADILLAVVDMGERVVLQATARDITERKQAEEEMRLLESAVAAVNESIIITDSDGTIVYVNPSFTGNTGFEADYAIGRTPAILNSKQQSKLFYKQFWNTISHGKPWAGRIMDRRKDGTIFPVYLSVAPIFDGQGEITHYIALHEDLSQAEALQKKMAQTQKMEAVGTMVGGIAHDFNNMLASIVGNFYLIRRQYPGDKKLQKRIASMEDATQHGANLIQQMLTFARKDVTEMRSLPLRSFIKEAHKLAEAAMPEDIHFGLNISSAKYICVKADATQLQQVLLNLVTNARHAVQDKFGDSGLGSISIELLCEQPPVKLLQGYSEMLNESDWVCIRCVDNGAGISAENMERVFEPFFTTKGVGKGTGLGMAMVYGAVQNHRGLIDIDSTPGEGTTVSVWLPQYQEKVVNVVGAEEVAFDGGGRTVLLVDDEGGLRKVLAEVLEHNGFVVLQASDGEQAVEIFRAHADQIAIVLMDVVMPNKGGVMAAQEIRQMDAYVPIIFQTGYGEQTQLDAAASITHSAALQKPVLIPEMLRTIMALIQS